VALAVLALFSFRGAVAAFTATTSNPANSLSAAATFPAYPALVTADGPQFQHRADDATSAAATSGAADASGNNRTGTYGGSTDGPSTWWRLDDATGSTAADTSGAANPATLRGDAAWTGGMSRGGAAFDGTGDYAAAARAAVRTDESFTAGVWVYLTNGTGYRTALSQAGSTTSGFFLQSSQVHGSRWRLSMPRSDTMNPADDQILGPSAALNAWTHLVAVHDDAADQMRLYVNGALVGSAAHSNEFHAGGALLAGRAQHNGGLVDDFQGRIDEVRTWRRALAPAEVAAEYRTPNTQYDFDEGSGTSAADASGSGNTGTLLNGAGWTPSRQLTGVTLDGADDYVAGAAAAVDTNESFTVAAWVYLTATGGVSRTVLSQPGITTSGFILKYEKDNGRWGFMLPSADAANSTAAQANSTTAAATSTWVHLTGVYDDQADEVRIYVNGRREGVVTATSDFTAAGPLTVGRVRYNGGFIDHFGGTIDNVRAYGHALGDAGVESLYRGPAVQWTFDEGAGTVAGDYSGNDNIGSLTAGAGWVAAGRTGDAATFDGTDDRVVAGAPAIRTDASFSVSAWAYLGMAWPFRTVASQDGTAVSGFFLQYNGVHDRWGFAMLESDSTSAVKQEVLSASAPVLNRWTHLVGVYDDEANQIRLYVNGVLASSTARTAEWNATGVFAVGRARYGGADADHFGGRIDEVAAYQRVLTATEVTDLYTESPSLRWDLDENNGTTTTADSSANGNTGTLNGGAAWRTAGHTGAAVTFDGTDDSVTATTSAVRTDTSFTVSAWAYPVTLGTHRTVLSQDGTAISGFMLKYEPVSNRWQLFMGETDSTAAVLRYVHSTAPPVLNAWTHLVAVYDDPADQIRLYVNGTLQQTATHTVDWNAAGVFAAGRGRWNSGPSDPFAGHIDEVTAYTRALGPAAVTHLYQATRPAPVPARTDPAEATAQLTGALQGPQQGQSGSTAVAYRGLSNGYNPVQYTNPAAFTIECWFRVSGTAGGQLLGFASTTTGDSATYDRTAYVDSGGRISFFVWTGSTRLIRSPATYNDGAWHHLAASGGPAGLKLYLDGALVAADATVTTAEASTGYWRWGGSRLYDLPDRPASDYLVGTLDEVAVYHTQLTDRQIARHYHANH
jgi:hypothetical protein